LLVLTVNHALLFNSRLPFLLFFKFPLLHHVSLN
jgi:hypothetical protein